MAFANSYSKSLKTTKMITCSYKTTYWVSKHTFIGTLRTVYFNSPSLWMLCRTLRRHHRQIKSTRWRRGLCLRIWIHKVLDDEPKTVENYFVTGHTSTYGSSLKNYQQCSELLPRIWSPYSIEITLVILSSWFLYFYLLSWSYFLKSIRQKIPRI